jgi:hypothetical protein
VSDRKLKSEILRDVQILYGSRLSGGGGGGGIEALTGDVTASGTGSVAATIAADAVTNAKLANMAANTLKGNNTGGSANPTDLTVSQVKSLLAISTSDVSGLGTLATQSGTFSGTSSGTNTGDQTSVSGNAGTATALQTGRTIAITGDVAYTSPAFDGTGNVTAAGTIQSGAVTLAKMANLAANSIIGNNTGSPATPIALTTAQVKTLLAIAAGDVSGLGTLATQSGTFSGTSSGTNTGDQTITLTSDVTGSGTGSFAATIANDAVTYAKMQNVSAASRLLGRGDSGSGDPQEITLGANLTMTGTTLAATGGGGISDGDKGDITVSGSGATWTIDSDVVTYAKMQNASAGNVVLARAASTSGDYSEVAVGASQLVGRGSTGDVAAITVGSGLSMSGTTLSATGGGGSPVVFVATGADTAINSTTDVTVLTRDVTSVGATDKLVVDCDFTIVNASGAARVYVVTLDFDGLFDVEFTTGSLAITTGHFFNMRGTLDIRSTSLAYGTFTIEGGLIAGLASGADTTMVATHLRTRGWGTTASDASGTTTVTLRIRSANATATQTCRLHNLTISKYTPT